jgi:hypothetical protein
MRCTVLGGKIEKKETEAGANYLHSDAGALDN